MRWLTQCVLCLVLSVCAFAQNYRRYNPRSYPFYLPVPVKVHQPELPLGFYQPNAQGSASAPQSFTNYAETNDPGMILWYQEFIKEQSSSTAGPTTDASTTTSTTTTTTTTRRPPSPPTRTTWVPPRYTHAPATRGTRRPLPIKFVTLQPAVQETTTRRTRPSVSARQWTTTTTTTAPITQTDATLTPVVPDTSTPGGPGPVGTDLEDHIDLFWQGLKQETKKFTNELHPMKEDFDELNARFATLMAYFVDGLYQRTRIAMRAAREDAPQMLRARNYRKN